MLLRVKNVCEYHFSTVDSPPSVRNDMSVDVVAVTPRPDFQLDLTYANGEMRRFDMRPLLTVKPCTRLVNIQLFERVTADYGTVVWPGELDIAPETLYDDSKPIPVITSTLSE